MIYAIEYRTTLSDVNEDDLIRLLIHKGANVNHIDISGLTPLFYAIYRGIPSVVKLLLACHADYRFENLLGYSSFRYALGCLSYANPHERETYQGRVDVVAILLAQFHGDELELKRAIVGYAPNVPYLFPLFDFIFYCRMRAQCELEAIGWKIYEETHWPCPPTYGSLLLSQNLIVFSQNIDNIVYFLQRMFIDNYRELILFYLQRVIKDKESTNRFGLLLYCALIETGGTRYGERIVDLSVSSRCCVGSSHRCLRHCWKTNGFTCSNSAGR